MTYDISVHRPSVHNRSIVQYIWVVEEGGSSPPPEHQSSIIPAVAATSCSPEASEHSKASSTFHARRCD